MSHGSSSSSSFVMRVPVGQPSSEPCSAAKSVSSCTFRPAWIVDAP